MHSEPIQYLHQLESEAMEQDKIPETACFGSCRFERYYIINQQTMSVPSPLLYIVFGPEPASVFAIFGIPYRLHLIGAQAAPVHGPNAYSFCSVSPLVVYKFD
jgi:hypothetical protein